MIAPLVEGSHARTFETVFQHPLPRNLEWGDVLGLVASVGEVVHEHNGTFQFVVNGERAHFARPHDNKDVTDAEEVLRLRRLFEHAGVGLRHAPRHTGPAPVGAHATDAGPAEAGPADPTSDPDRLRLVVVLDHHGARVYRLTSLDTDGSAAAHFTPYDPHGFLRHLEHRKESDYQGQRAPEDPILYGHIARAVAGADEVLLIGHGTGTSNAATHLAHYLAAHHRETAARVVGQLDADLSALSERQLLALARQRLGVPNGARHAHDVRA